MVKLHTSKMKPYILFVFGFLIFGEQITKLTADESTDSVTNGTTGTTPTGNLTTQTIPVTSEPTTEPTTEVTNSSIETTKLPIVTTNEPTTVAPPSVKNPSVGSWTVHNTIDNVTCIKLDAAIQFRIVYEQIGGNVTAKLNLPKNATVRDNTCESHSIHLVFDGNEFVISFKNESDKITATTFNLTYILDNTTFPFAKNLDQKITAFVTNESYFEAPAGKSYLCKVESIIDINEVKVSMQDVRVEAFRNKKDDSFSDAKECSGDEKINDIVPIAVGCALAALVVIVLIAYLVGRQRSRQQGYQSV